MINLTGQLGIRAHRVNLYDAVNHVIAEVEVRPGSFILVNAQDNPQLNQLFDGRDKVLDEVVGPPHANYPFYDYSNIHLRRLPLVSRYVQRVRLKNSWITWALRNPWLILSLLAGSFAVGIGFVLVADEALIRIYASRLGIPASFVSPRRTIALDSKTPMHHVSSVIDNDVSGVTGFSCGTAE